MINDQEDSITTRIANQVELVKRSVNIVKEQSQFGSVLQLLEEICNGKLCAHLGVNPSIENIHHQLYWVNYYAKNHGVDIEYSHYSAGTLH